MFFIYLFIFLRNTIDQLTVQQLLKLTIISDKLNWINTNSSNIVVWRNSTAKTLYAFFQISIDVTKTYLVSLFKLHSVWLFFSSSLGTLDWSLWLILLSGHHWSLNMKKVIKFSTSKTDEWSCSSFCDGIVDQRMKKWREMHYPL